MRNGVGKFNLPCHKLATSYLWQGKLVYISYLCNHRHVAAQSPPCSLVGTLLSPSHNSSTARTGSPLRGVSSSRSLPSPSSYPAAPRLHRIKYARSHSDMRMGVPLCRRIYKCGTRDTPDVRQTMTRCGTHDTPDVWHTIIRCGTWVVLGSVSFSLNETE
jgi:hypothetical protein